VLFNSYSFIFAFLPVALLGFYLLGSRDRARLAVGWLFFASVFFYGWWNPAYVVLILASIVVNYHIGCGLGRTGGKNGRHGRALLVAGLCFNLGLLAYYKYTNFFIGNVNGLFGFDLPNADIILPLGISFFTFQEIAYLVDAYEGKAREYSFLDYGLFVSFFPQLIAGPIVHHQEMMPQFKKGRFSFNPSHLAAGITIFSLGLFKKVILADNLALYATPVFDAAKAGEPVGTALAWVGALSYTFQIYFDFSGYSDMAIGLGRMFGIKLPLNFNSPYKATGAIDFWRRWHMTLSRMLRDYLYIPLGGSRRGPFRRYLNVMIVMLLGGLWHGAHWTFVLWGACHGVFLMINRAWRTAAERFGWGRTRSAVGRRLAWTATFLSVVLAWVLFRAEGFPAALRLYRAMFLWSAPAVTPYPLKVDHAMALLVCLLFVRLLPNTQEFMRRYEPAVDFKEREAFAPPGFLKRLQWQPRKVWAIVLAVVFAISVFNMVKVTEFLYFQF